MFDGIKIQDVATYTDHTGATVLLTTDRLTFGALVDPETGFVLDPIQRAVDRGLTFRRVPRRTGEGYRVEVKGSLHKFFNHGQHNADQFTATDLLLTLDQLVTVYGIDPFTSQINTLEFGVNVVLPFPVAEVLQNLVSYKNRPFTRDTRSGTPYYECQFQRFTVKLYDKGKQRGWASNLLRVEIKVSKMAYFDKTGVHLDTLTDLLTRANYRPLGVLLMDTFDKILFDDPTINPDTLSPREREIYQNGSNPRYWQTPDNLTPTQANTRNQRLRRTEQRYRTLLDKHRRGENRPAQTAALIAQTWDQLTNVSDSLLTRIDERRAAWQHLTKSNILPGSDRVDRFENDTRNPPKTATQQPPVYCAVTVPNQPKTCHELTGLTISFCGNFCGNSPGEICHELTNAETADLSRINPLCSALQPDTMNPPANPEPEPIICPVTGELITNPKPKQRFVSASMLHHNDDLLMGLNQRFTSYRNGSQEDEYSRAAHNVRNQDSNPRNNLRRQLIRYQKRTEDQLLLFPEQARLTLTDKQRALLDYWKGTPFELPI